MTILVSGKAGGIFNGGGGIFPLLAPQKCSPDQSKTVTRTKRQLATPVPLLVSMDAYGVIVATYTGQETESCPVSSHPLVYSASLLFNWMEYLMVREP